jgi:VWFA-related protein
VKFFAVSVFVLLLATPSLAQSDDVVRVKSNLVNIDVLVKDKKGKYVPDLKAEDFTISENGVQQKIEFFDAPLAGTKRDPTAAAPGKPSGETPGPPTAARNYVALVIDSQTTDVTNLKQVREGMLKYAREQLTNADIVALLSVSNDLHLIQQFTQDKNQIIAALEKLGTANTAKNFRTKRCGSVDERRSAGDEAVRLCAD